MASNGRAELALENICNNAVVSSTEVIVPDLRLFLDGFFIAVDGLVLWLFDNSIQLVVHAVQQESEQLLGILLPVTAELSCDA